MAFFRKMIFKFFDRMMKNQIKRETEKILMLNAQNRIAFFDYSKLASSLHEVEFSAYSQWGDDGIIQYLINHLNIKSQTFIEFGVENYLESNTRFLLINNNWEGLVIDSSSENINFIKNDSVTWRFSLKSVCAFIEKENINDLIRDAGFENEIGILSIDIDGNDYWIWQQINVINPVIVIAEYNSILGDDRPVSIPYDAKFNRTEAHYSNLYFGCSLPALCHLAEIKGYYFIGCDKHGVNAYFVRKDMISDLKPLTAKEGYVKSKFSQARSKNGILLSMKFEDQVNLLRGMPVVNVVTNQQEKL